MVYNRFVKSGEARIERQPLSIQVADRLRNRIAAGDYPVGSRLPTEPELVAEFGVGRSSIREAVQALAQAGILDVRQGSGTYVRALPAEAEPLTARLRRARIAEVHEARRLLEGQIAHLAALRRTDADLAAMRTALDRRETIRAQGLTENLTAFADADLAFHQAVARASGNAVLNDLYESFVVVIREALITLNRDVPAAQAEGRKDHQAALHERLYQAIESRRPGEARTAVDELLGDIIETIDTEP